MPTAPTLLAFLPDIGGGEMVVVLLIVLMLFGGDKMPQLAKGLGKSIREFKKAASGVEQEFKKALDIALVESKALIAAQRELIAAAGSLEYLRVLPTKPVT